MDAPIDNVDRVETELAGQVRTLVDRDLTVVFYDLTTVGIHAEGDEDIRAHVMICFLALVLYGVMQAKGRSASPRTAFDILAQIHRHYMKIADRKLKGIPPTPEQLELFDTLNCRNPPDQCRAATFCGISPH